MDNNVKSVFEDECRTLVIDTRLIKKIHAYQIGFTMKNPDHIAFFGGNTIGVQVVRFTDADRDMWFEDILNIDESPLEERLLALPKINSEWNVSSDAMNLSCIWLTHAIHISPHLTEQQKHDAKIDVMLVMQYKFLTSRLFRHFRYPADPAVAEATYAQLSFKFALKVHGSWAALLLARSEDIITAKDPNTGRPSIHYQTIATMDNDDDVVNMLNDTQGRIRDMLKNIYSVFMRINDQGIRISTVSSVIEHDGVEILKDKSKNVLAYGRYLNSIVSDRNSFIREELLTIIEKLIHTMPPRLFRMTLTWMSDNYRQQGAGEIEEVLNGVLVHGFDYLSTHKTLMRNSSDYAVLLTTLKGVYMSSRSVDPDLMVLRQRCEEIVKKATHNKNTSLIASVRTGVLLYLILRALTKNHYTNNS